MRLFVKLPLHYYSEKKTPEIIAKAMLAIYKSMIFVFLTFIFLGVSFQTMASEITIRPLQSRDWENFRKLRLEALQESPKAYGISRSDEAYRTDDEWETLCHDAQNGNGKWYVVAVTQEGSFIGMLGAVEIFGEFMRHQVEVIQAYVNPEYRRLKIMEQLFFSLKEQLLKVDHLEQMIVWVTLHENQVGKEMFEKFGFAFAGFLSKTVKFEGKYYDCCWLEAPLRDFAGD